MAAPIEHARREYLAFLRGPGGFSFGTVGEVRSGTPHGGRVSVFPAPSDGETSDFGIQRASGFTVEIADEEDGNWKVLLEDFSRIVLEDGSGNLIMEF